MLYLIAIGLPCKSDDSAISLCYSLLGLQVLLRQTSLDEPAIHVRYMRFRQDYPTGFIGPAALNELCASHLTSEEERQGFVSLVFRWGKSSKFTREGKGLRKF